MRLCHFSLMLKQIGTVAMRLCHFSLMLKQIGTVAMHLCHFSLMLKQIGTVAMCAMCLCQLQRDEATKGFHPYQRPYV